MKKKKAHPPPPLPDIVRVTTIKILGLTFTSSLSVAEHVHKRANFVCPQESCAPTAWMTSHCRQQNVKRWLADEDVELDEADKSAFRVINKLSTDKLGIANGTVY